MTFQNQIDVTDQNQQFSQMRQSFEDFVPVLNSLNESIISNNDVFEIQENPIVSSLNDSVELNIDIFKVFENLTKTIGVNLSYTNKVEKELNSLIGNYTIAVNSIQNDLLPYMKSLEETNKLLLSTSGLQDKLIIYTLIFPAILLFATSSILIILDIKFKKRDESIKILSVLGFIVIIIIPYYGQVEQRTQADDFIKAMQNRNQLNNQYFDKIEDRILDILLIQNKVLDLGAEHSNYSHDISNKLNALVEEMNSTTRN
jgi:hypothetical protein